MPGHPRQRGCLSRALHMPQPSIRFEAKSMPAEVGNCYAANPSMSAISRPSWENGSIGLRASPAHAQAHRVLLRLHRPLWACSRPFRDETENQERGGMQQRRSSMSCTWLLPQSASPAICLAFLPP